MSNYYRIGTNISSHLRAKGYNVTFSQCYTSLTFFLDNKFLFCTFLDILSETEVEKIITELIEEKENVHIHSKDKRPQ